VCLSLVSHAPASDFPFLPRFSWSSSSSSPPPVNLRVGGAVLLMAVFGGVDGRNVEAADILLSSRVAGAALLGVCLFLRGTLCAFLISVTSSSSSSLSYLLRVSMYCCCNGFVNGPDVCLIEYALSILLKSPVVLLNGLFDAMGAAAGFAPMKSSPSSYMSMRS
jgi:hypothetical protein